MRPISTGGMRLNDQLNRRAAPAAGQVEATNRRVRLNAGLGRRPPLPSTIMAERLARTSVRDLDMREHPRNGTAAITLPRSGMMLATSRECKVLLLNDRELPRD